MPREASYRGSISPTSTLASCSPKSVPGPKPTIAVPVIPRPKKMAAAVFVNEKHHEDSLQVQMGLTKRRLKSLIPAMRKLIVKHMNGDIPYDKQPKALLLAYEADCSRLPELRRYPNGWPALPYCRLYLAGHCRYLRNKRRALSPEVPVPRPMAKQEEEDVDEPPRTPSPTAIPSTPVAKPSRRNVEPPSPTTSLTAPGTPVTRRHLASACSSGSSHAPSLSKFFATFEPPHNSQILKVFTEAGVRGPRDLEAIASNDHLEELFFSPLRLNGKLTHLQECLVKAAMRREFPPAS
ncbi:hypothetical protein PsYK624_032530 [Phanerochaete sordida]|uniref:Uncharacterized protein n=1 Tax=Phanerochaete sordida TaxID=48140 RepID=A0A9P3G3F8_9APHY|nr:hypothetical protein PsYK624_032530 [Phanerochaete sordida]